MSSPGTRITNYVLAKLEAEPVAKCVEIYRDLADLAATADDRARFEQLAKDCAAVANARDQLVFDFKRRAAR
jgi:hypothetical protein